jgi:tripartite ATP-independent transporter DctP family solute receptor
MRTLVRDLIERFNPDGYGHQTSTPPAAIIPTRRRHKSQRGFLLGALLLCSGAAMAQTTLRAWNTHPEGYPVTEALQYFADTAQRNTQDRVRIKVFSNAVLGDQDKAVKMMKVGELEVAEFNIAPLAEAVPAVKVLTRPFLFRDSKHMFQHIDGPLGVHMESQLKDAGFVVLGWYDGGARSFYCTNKPIHGVQDLTGERIRVQQSEAAIEMVKLLGGTPVVLPYKDVGEALKDGRIDCAENNMPAYESTGHMKSAKYVLLTYHTVAPEALVMSVAAWNRLGPDDQIRVLEAGRSSALRMRELWSQRLESSRLAATKQGTQFAPMGDSGAVVKRLTPMFAKYLKDPESRSEVFTILAN